MSYSTYAPTEITTNSDVLSSAKAKYREQDYLGALTEYTTVIQLNPHDALSICNRGVVYYRLGDKQNAKIDYDNSIEIDPKLSIAYYRRGFLNYTAKDYANAITDFNKSIDLKPDFALAYSNRGYAYRDLYGEQEALIDWRFAAKLFKEQGNLVKYKSTMKLIDKITDIDTFASGMLW
jgi:tetratricopeptide (TPR) repeat protein